MLSRSRQQTPSVEARLFAMADRLFDEFDDLPAGEVFEAIGGARASLSGEPRGAPSPEEIESIARQWLLAGLVGRLLHRRSGSRRPSGVALDEDVPGPLTAGS